MIIRQEKADDYEEVYGMVKRSFATTDFSDGTEADYLANLRAKECFIPELSFVAVDSGKIVGQIVLYRMQINCGNRKEEQLVISPLSVHPDYFKRGIGTKLIAQGCKLAVEHGYKAVFLCGSYAYYSRFGFVPTYKYDVFHIKDETKKADWCMVKELEEGYLASIKGTISIE